MAPESLWGVIEEWSDIAEPLRSKLLSARDEIARLRADYERLREALGFYANEDNWTSLEDSIYEHPEPWGTAVAALVDPEGATDWDSRVDFAVAGEDVRETTPGGATDGCEVSSFSSRVCERGTKGCDTVHG